MAKRILIAASVLAVAAGMASTAFAQLPAGYSRLVATSQLETMLQAAQLRGLSPAVAAKFRSEIAARPDKVDQVAGQLASEGINIGTASANLPGNALIDAAIGKMSDGRGTIEAAIGTSGPNRTPVSIGNMPGIGDRTSGLTTIRTPGASPSGTSTSDKSMISDGIFSRFVNWLFGDDKAKEDNRRAAQEAKERYEKEEQAQKQKEEKPKCDTDEDPMCGTSGFVAGGRSNSPKMPDPTGETRAKPGQLSPGEVANALGGKQGQVTNPAPDSANGSGNFTGGTGNIPAVRGGGVSDPAGPVVVNPGVTAARPKTGTLDPLINPGDTPVAGNKPAGATGNGVSNPGKAPGGGN